MRLIDADDLIERFDLLEKSPFALRGMGLKPIMAIEDIKTVIQAAPTVGATNWISVKDRLPEDGEEVVANMIDSNEVVTYRNSKWYAPDEYYTTNVVAYWIPIPKFP